MAVLFLALTAHHVGAALYLLFVFGAPYLAVSRIVTRRIVYNDTLNAGLQPLRSFVLPGGSPAAAALHLARTVVRRTERIMVALAAVPGEPVNREGIGYINRVSDFLFVAARAVNDNGNADVLWVPGKNR